MSNLTSRQREVITAISAHWREHGYAPSIRELAEALGLRSTHAAWCHLHLLQKKGAVTWTPGTARTLRVVGGGG